MKLPVILLLVVLVFPAKGQFYSSNKNAVSFKQISLADNQPVTQTAHSWWGLVLKADKPSNYRLRLPLLMIKSQSNIFSGESYWAGAITTQSYNRGKLGTFYYWDVQGNLRESKFFFDIAGKNKRGLKLVIPRR